MRARRLVGADPGLFELGKAFPTKFLTEKWANLGLQTGQSVILAFPQTRCGSPVALSLRDSLAQRSNEPE